MPSFDETKQEEKLAELRGEEAESLAKILSEKYNVPYIDLATVSIESDALRNVDEETARRALIAPFQITGKELHVATATPEKDETTRALEELRRGGFTLHLYLASKRGLERVWERYQEVARATATEAGVLDVSSEQVDAFTKRIKALSDVVAAIEEVLAGGEKYETTRVLEMLVAGALATEASDIHVEPEEKNVTVRYRLDGVLQELTALNEKVYTLLLSRIKLISGLKLNVKNDAQNGRFTIKIKDADVEVRTSTVPGAYGESVVLRILNPKTIAVPFEELGMEQELRTIVETEMRKPNGMILNTGPTGSGKTTTLYAILRKINAPGIKIITIEDPIEYHLPGITQTQVDPDAGYTFIQGMRSGLRQDPDVIMVGEIRDNDTADTAIHAALTGHLVLSTLHTNNAAGTIPRLIDLGVNPSLIGSALSVALAQRLLRRLCAACKKEDAPTAEERALIAAALPLLVQRDPSLDGTRVWRAGSCAECNNTGYKGRIGIFEAIRMDAKIEELARTNPSEREIKKAARSQGLLFMREDGILKVLRGVTSFDELRRVIDLSAEDAA
ncbi:MAG: type II/IV secretion system protein [Parcubacteria group bacterium]|nr:type II/IV secretion system protein [Parcubacteria group bacterium]